MPLKTLTFLAETLRLHPTQPGVEALLTDVMAQTVGISRHVSVDHGAFELALKL